MTPHILAFATGFLSLSQEILWIRLAGFANWGVPQVLGVVLCFYLLGIAIGAHVGKRWCEPGRDHYALCGRLLLGAAAFDLAAPWLVAGAMGLGWLVGLAALLAALVATAAFKSVVFPIAHYLGSDASGPRVGTSVSRVYASNIAGSTLGPLVTGFFLLDVLDLQRNFILMAALTAAVGLLCLARAGARVVPVALAASAAFFAAALAPALLMPRVIGATADAAQPVLRIVENRSGIIHLTREPGRADTTYGGNVYDGRITTDLLQKGNRIERLYAVAALHPEASEILSIGLSSGAWSAVLAGLPRARRIDVVEINEGYLPVIRDYAEVSPILGDPRVHVHIDDGRRWVRRNPDRRFDVIVMNTTFHWRSYTSMLLSGDFVEIARSRLRPGGVFAYNGTGSIDAYETVARRFRHAYLMGTLVIGSDRELSLTPESLGATLAAMRVSGRTIDASVPEVEARIREIAAELRPYAAVRAELVARAGREPEPITDQNLVGEYRHSEDSPVAQRLRAIYRRLAGAER